MRFRILWFGFYWGLGVIRVAAVGDRQSGCQGRGLRDFDHQQCLASDITYILMTMTMTWVTLMELMFMLLLMMVRRRSHDDDHDGHDDDDDDSETAGGGDDGTYDNSARSYIWCHLLGHVVRRF